MTYLLVSGLCCIQGGGDADDGPKPRTCSLPNSMAPTLPTSLPRPGVWTPGLQQLMDVSHTQQPFSLSLIKIYRDPSSPILLNLTDSHGSITPHRQLERHIPQSN
jgi:hypothetical protein